MPKPDYQEFIKKYPRYPNTQNLDHIRAQDYPMLDQQAHVYLDYTGAGLYAESQLESHQRLLKIVFLAIRIRIIQPPSCRPLWLKSRVRKFWLISMPPRMNMCVFSP